MTIEFPNLNDRIVSFFSKKEGIDNTLSLLRDVISLTSIICPQKSHDSFTKINGTISLVKSGFDLFYSFESLSMPKEGFNFAKNICYGVEGLIDPILFFEEVQLYKLPQKASFALNIASYSLYMGGLVMGLINDSFELSQITDERSKHLRTLDVIGDAIDIASTILGIINSILITAILVPIIALLGIISSSIAIFELWVEQN